MLRSVTTRIYPGLLCLLAVGMTTSVFLTNLVWVLLLANWVAEWDWGARLKALRSSRLLQAFLVLMGIHLLWLAGTADLAYGLYDIQKKLPLAAIPLVVLTSRPLARRELLCVAAAHGGTLLVLSVIGVVRLLTIPGLPYRELVPYISHIRLGLNICLFIGAAAALLFRCRRRWVWAAGAGAALWMLFFLYLLRAYTAFAVLFVSAAVLLICRGRRLPAPLRLGLPALFAAAVAAVALLFLHYRHDYYTLPTAAALPTATANGNPYTHGTDGLIENGAVVSQCVCEEELRQQWPRYSRVPIDSLTPVGYPVLPALVRYLNAIGATKDSAGLTRLAPADVAAIEQGVANPVYLSPGPRRLFYVLFFEQESRRCHGSVSNFSMLQRYELWEAGFRLFLRRPFFGAGTGDVPRELDAELAADGSPLAGSGLHTHSQYLNFLLAFGLTGFLLIAAAFARALRRRPCSGLFIFFLCITLVSFLTEDTLETLAGITFVAFGFALLAPRGESAAG